jgi:hypothetical protein
MIIEWEGRTREVESARVSMKQAFVIKESTKDDEYPAGRSLAAWQEGLSTVEPGCVRALYWLMLQQEGTECPIVSLEFPVIKFNNAVVTALVAERKADEARAAAEARVQASMAPPVPTSAPSPEPSSPPTTTPLPQPASASRN